VTANATCRFRSAAQQEIKPQSAHLFGTGSELAGDSVVVVEGKYSSDLGGRPPDQPSGLTQVFRVDRFPLTPFECQRFMEATQKGETAGGVCCEGQTIRHGVRRPGV
jgi:hypothetical protein